MMYGGVQRDRRASEGNAILVNKYWKNWIHSYTWHSERLVSLSFKIDRGYLSIIAVHGPEEGRKELAEKFYNYLQRAGDRCNKNDYITIAEDFSARVSDQSIPSIIEINGEKTINQYGKIFITQLQ